MKKIVVVPDSFKGTLSSLEICHIVKEAALVHFPESEVTFIPVADGGEGTVECFNSALGGKVKNIVCKNPYFEEIDGFYGIAGGTAIIEMAASSGLPFVEHRKNPMLTTTYGVGEMILDACLSGCKKIILGLGGSATNDCGCGAAAALGVKFYDKNGNTFIPTGGTLKNVEKIDVSGVNEALCGVDICAMCDIDNPMYGESGAAYVFAPQKGADEEMVKKLDDGLRHISDIIKRDLGIDVSEVPGGGAAGAMGAGMYAFLGVKLNSGIETVLETVKFDDIIKDADLIITGEGKIDSQSLDGKVISGVAKRCKVKDKPVLVIVGGAEDGIEKIYDMGVTAVFTINRLPEDFSVSRYKSKNNLKVTADNIFRLLKIK